MKIGESTDRTSRQLSRSACDIGIRRMGRMGVPATSLRRRLSSIQGTGYSPPAKTPCKTSGATEGVTSKIRSSATVDVSNGKFFSSLSVPEGDREGNSKFTGQKPESYTPAGNQMQEVRRQSGKSSLIVRGDLSKKKNRQPGQKVIEVFSEARERT